MQHPHILPEPTAADGRCATRWPSWRHAAPGTGLPSPRHTVARIHGRNEQMTEIILAKLKAAPLNSREAAIEMGCSQKNINYHLGKLRNRGQAQFDPQSGCWVPSHNGIVRERAAQEVRQMVQDWSLILSRRLLVRLIAVAELLEDQTQG